MQATNTKARFKPIVYRSQHAFHHGWNNIPGLAVEGHRLVIEPGDYFERFEEPWWHFVPWREVQARWEALEETAHKSLEQCCLEFIEENKLWTEDPAQVLANAEAVYSFVFDEGRLKAMPDVTFESNDLRILRESSVLCALNKVDLTGHITNIGPAWYFAQTARKVYGLTNREEIRVDELFHGGFFNGLRQRDQVKAHTALAGKLVHGCQSSGHGSGGCVVSFGTNLSQMQRELLTLRPKFLNLLES
jgi:hypothetical protein